MAVVGILSSPPKRPPRNSEGPLLPRLQLLRVLGAGQTMLVADYYWLQMIQQMGRASSAEEFRDIYPYANLTTDLDPTFSIVYWYAGASIPFNSGREHWENAAESTAIIKKGLKRFPDDFRLNFFLAYNLQYYDKKFHEAAQLVQWLSTQPKAPWFLKALATRLFAQAGDFDAGVSLAEAMRDSATDEDSRKFFDLRILEIRQERLLSRVDEAGEKFQTRTGHLPSLLEELVASGDLTVAPVDPLGGMLYLDAKGHAQSTASKHRLQLYNHNEGDAP